LANKTPAQVAAYKANFTKKPPGKHGAAVHGQTLDPVKETDRHWLALLNEVGGQLREIRKGQGHALINLASMLGLNSPGNLPDIERGRIPGVSLYRLWKIADALGYELQVTFTRKPMERRRGRKEKRGGTARGVEEAEGDRDAGLPSGDPDRNVVQLRPIQPYPSWYTGHRG